MLHRIWTGKEGLDRAKKELENYFNVHQKLPTSTMFSNILRVIIKGYWKELNIQSWNDLLRDVFGKVNVLHRIWTGKEGLNRARKELKIYFNVHQKLPTSTMFPSIVKAIERRYWKDYNIRLWNDLLRDVFGKVNVIQKTWKEKEGLDRAKLIIKYKIKHGKYYKTNEYCVKDIKRALIRKYWIEFGIITWEDLIQYVLNDSH